MVNESKLMFIINSLDTLAKIKLVYRLLELFPHTQFGGAVEMRKTLKTVKKNI